MESRYRTGHDRVAVTASIGGGNVPVILNSVPCSQIVDAGTRSRLGPSPGLALTVEAPHTLSGYRHRLAGSSCPLDHPQQGLAASPLPPMAGWGLLSVCLSVWQRLPLGDHTHSRAARANELALGVPLCSKVAPESPRPTRRANVASGKPAPVGRSAAVVPRGKPEVRGRAAEPPGSLPNRCGSLPAPPD